MISYQRTDFLYVAVVLFVGFAFFWVICRVFRIRRRGIPHLAAIIVAFVMSTYNPVVILAAAPLFVLGFVSGRSTKVHTDPTDVLSPRIKVSDVEYAYLAERHLRMLQSPMAEKFFLSPQFHWTEKLSFMFQGFGLYRHARGVALSTSWLYVTIWSAASLGGSGELLLLLFVLSLPFGTSMGLLWKYIKGHPGSPKLQIGG